jgi:hypothetical protein
MIETDVIRVLVAEVQAFTKDLTDYGSEGDIAAAIQKRVQE